MSAYAVLYDIGSGANGTVSVVRDVDTNEAYALKTCSFSTWSHSDEERKLRREKVMKEVST